MFKQTNSQDLAWEGRPRTSVPGATREQRPSRSQHPGPSPHRQHTAASRPGADSRVQQQAASVGRGTTGSVRVLVTYRGEAGRGSVRDPHCHQARSPTRAPRGGRLGAVPACAGRSLRQQQRPSPSLPALALSCEAGQGQSRPGAGQWEKGNKKGRCLQTGARDTAGASLQPGTHISD